MKIEISKVADGKYGLLSNPNLFFTFEEEHEIILDKKSAFQIAWTLIDSLNMLSDEVEEFLYEVEETLDKNNYVKIEKAESWKAVDIQPITKKIKIEQEKFYEGLTQRVGNYLSKKERLDNEK